MQVQKVYVTPGGGVCVEGGGGGAIPDEENRKEKECVCFSKGCWQFA